VVSPNFSGSFILTFPKKTFLNLASKVLDEKFLEISDANEDFAGELSNIILGKTKRLWVDKGFDVEKAIPTVQTGVKFSLHSGENIPTIIIPFESDFGPFYAIISILWN
jgi:chemotaxis protein CheX